MKNEDDIYMSNALNKIRSTKIHLSINSKNNIDLFNSLQNNLIVLRLTQLKMVAKLKHIFNMELTETDMVKSVFGLHYIIKNT